MNYLYFPKFTHIKLVIPLEILCRTLQLVLVHLWYEYDQVEEEKKLVIKI